MKRGAGVAVVAIASIAIAVLTNIATNEVPSSWSSFLWLAWPITALLAVASIGLEFFRVKREEPESPTSQRTNDSFADRVSSLQELLDQSAMLLPELQAELAVRNATLSQLRADAEHYEQLVDLNKKQAEAVEKLVARTISGSLKATTKLSSRQQALYFFLGIVASVPLNILASFLWAKYGGG